LQLDGNIQAIDSKIVLAIGHFQQLQLQNDYLLTQNQILVRTPSLQDLTTLMVIEAYVP